MNQINERSHQSHQAEQAEQGDRGATILIIDDDPGIHRVLTLLLQSEPSELEVSLHPAFSGKEGLQKAEAISPDLILLDLNMPQMNGMEALKSLMQTDKVQKGNIPIVIFTAYGSVHSAVRAIKLGAAQSSKQTRRTRQTRRNPPTQGEIFVFNSNGNGRGKIRLELNFECDLSQSIDLKQFKERIAAAGEKLIISEVKKRFAFNQTELARFLAIDSKTLRSKVRAKSEKERKERKEARPNDPSNR